jgi:hypothetical protein
MPLKRAAFPLTLPTGPSVGLFLTPYPFPWVFMITFYAMYLNNRANSWTYKLQSWRRRQQVLLNHQYLPTRLHDVTSQKSTMQTNINMGSLYIYQITWFIYNSVLMQKNLCCNFWNYYCCLWWLVTFNNISRFSDSSIQVIFVTFRTKFLWSRSHEESCIPAIHDLSLEFNILYAELQFAISNYSNTQPRCVKINKNEKTSHCDLMWTFNFFTWPQLPQKLHVFSAPGRMEHF